MKKISDFEPKKVFYFFEEISKIPRGSGYTEKIADYCFNFAKDLERYLIVLVGRVKLRYIPMTTYLVFNTKKNNLTSAWQ